MSSGFTVNGVDLDSIFKPRGSTTAAANVGFTVGGTDISDRYMASTSSSDRIASATGLTHNGTDLKDIFRDINYVNDPTITSQPSGGTRQVGGSITFSVTATGTGTLSYQWRKNGSNISGATSSSYTKNPIALSDAGSYDCVVTGSLGSVTSNAAALHISPSITTDCSGSGTLNVGDVFNISIVATGETPLFYQWRKNGSNISGATSSSYSHTVASGDGGNYDCVVSNAYGSSTSSTYALTVQGAPTITSHPSNATAREGTNPSFSVAATGGSLSYQWQKDGTNIPGETLSTLVVYNVDNSDEGSYRCVVTNSAGSTTSNSATLTVIMDPHITSNPSGGTLNIGNVASFSVTASGESLSYQWRKNGTNIAGATSATLTFTVTSGTNAGTYDCVVSNPYTSVTSSGAVLNVNVSNPSITTQPSGFTATDGDGPIALQCAANVPSSEGPVYFTWYKNGVQQTTRRVGNITGGASGFDQHVFNPVHTSDAGSWVCVVTTDYGGGTNSSTATVTVNP